MLWKEVRADAARPWQFGMQDPATPIAEGIMEMHHDLMVVMVFVVVFVGWILGRAVYHFREEENKEGDGVVHGTVIEIVWTLVPAGMLMVIAVPSFALLYAVDEVVEPSMTLKVVGHQWYWSYEYRGVGYGDGGETLEFDSYMVTEDSLEEGGLRLLEVDNRIKLPVEKHIRLVVTSGDVLHSWAVPSLGVKMDACPGRLNQVSVWLKRPGVYYGQCSELCGVNHAFMPIAVEGVDEESFKEWVVGMYDDE
uniref:Cytochrome c oxidase subunit 2 n=1 Tax=Labyrinthula sp. TaxID=1678526 RepID=A0A7S6U9R9_9STRA|nr:cytochrome c oxidase subunit 2 [Labyrinthula sp.]